MNSFLATVIIPTYQYSNFICDAIESILSQSLSQGGIEVIVIDDGSTDDTAEKVRKYKSKVKYIYQPNSGKAWATKVGIEAAQGQYIFNLDADDLFLPSKIEKVVSIFEKDSDIIHVAHPAICWDTNEHMKTIEPLPAKVKGHKVYGKDLLSYFYTRKMLFGGGSTFAGRANVLKAIPIKKEIDMFIDEYLVLSTLNCGHSFFIEEPLSLWRIHSRNYSGNHVDRKKLERSLLSIEAVLSEVLESDFEKELKILYLLRTKVTHIAAKEMVGEKSLSDILDLWSYVLKNYKFFGTDVLTIVKSYNLFNRTLPTFVLRRLKERKVGLGE